MLSCATPWMPSIHGAVTCSTCEINGLGGGMLLGGGAEVITWSPLGRRKSVYRQCAYWQIIARGVFDSAAMLVEPISWLAGETTLRSHGTRRSASPAKEQRRRSARRHSRVRIPITGDGGK